jgi:hypothetical protein
MTFNSIIKTPYTILWVDFMDPWTGDIRQGELNTVTGHVAGFNGAGPSGTLDRKIIVCPKETDPGGGGSGEPRGSGSGPNPPPIPLPLPYPGHWWIRTVVIDQNTVICYEPETYTAEKPGEIPRVFYLSQNHPTPLKRNRDCLRYTP